ncbi:MAG: hypothetical protein DSZ05_02145 [Sulfurospirillum sp.]|nr:MAG: hypothetical protein DSZ05_02145 [Sulfurospirillum sp.]
MKKGIVVLSMVTVGLFNGCGGSAVENDTATTGTGYYIDSAVSGVDYVCGMQTGKTGTDGSFIFEKGADCTFSIGDMILRKVDSRSLKENVKIIEDNLTVATLLQTLDSDGDPEKAGITISPEVARILQQNKIVKLPENENEVVEIYEMIKNVNDYHGTLKSVEEARAHLNKTKKSFADNTSNSSQKGLHGDGIFTYKGLQWQDNDEIKGNRVQYADRNSYCSQLRLGGYSDWRLPSVEEFNQLNEVKDQLHFAWSEENYIYWTSDSTESIIRMYNLSNGMSPLYHIDRLTGYGWSIRCVRDTSSSKKDEDKQSAAQQQNVNSDITYESKISDIFQGYSSKTTTVAFQYYPRATLYLFDSDKSFRFGDSNSEVNGSYQLSGNSVKSGETLLELKQGDRVIYTITYLGAYKKHTIFVRINNNAINNSYISLMNPYRGSFERIVDEADETYGGIEQMYRALFK